MGKSTVAAQLAASLARGGRRVGLLDLDLCGPSLAQMLGVAGKRVEGSAAGWMPVKPGKTWGKEDRHRQCRFHLLFLFLFVSLLRNRWI